ncbi:MAG: NapC/NirT family cytochrome c, partial [Blastocatellia bacterium]|nr:NapC/NirT family cytochrome c [Blastocatellia bacterium]
FGLGTWAIVALTVNIVLVGVVVLKPSLTDGRGGKTLVFLSFFIFPILVGGLGHYQHVERFKTTEFCLSCHVMQDYGKSLHVDDRAFIPAVHYQNNLVPRDKACYTCHTDYTMFGGVTAKLRGLNHVYVQYFGQVPQKVKLYNPYQNRECLQCHLGARSFEEGATHNMEPNRLALIKASQLSCLTSECHDTTHNVAKLKELQYWKESSK